MASSQTRSQPADGREHAHVVTEAEQGQRVDRLVAALSGAGRAGARRLLEAGQVRLNGRRPPKGAVLRAGDRLALTLPERGVGALPNPELPLTVVYEAPGLLVVDKPAGMHCHPLQPEDRSTLVSAALARYPELAGLGYSPLQPGLLHRIDRDTSGLVLFARDARTFAHFARALRPFLPWDREVSGDCEGRREVLRPAGTEGGGTDVEVIRKRYLALCAGRLTEPGVHRAWLRAQGPRVRVFAAAGQGRRPIETAVVGVEPVGRFTRVELSVPSAARHQVRAHLAALGHPIVGDVLYGGPQVPGLGRHFLHASRLSLRPAGGEDWVELESPLPSELERTLVAVR